MSSLISLIFIILIIAAVVVIGPIITRRLNVKINLYIIGGYLAILIILSVVCILIPSSALKAPIDPVQASQYLNNGDAIGMRIAEGNYDAPEGFMKTVNTFNRPADNITVSCSSDLNGMVYVGTKGIDVPDNGNNKLEIYSYTAANISFNARLYSAQIAPPVPVLEAANSLMINSAVKESVDFYQFNDGYAVPQFSGADISHGSWGSSSNLTVVVLLPPGVTAEGSGYQQLSALVSAFNSDT